MFLIFLWGSSIVHSIYSYKGPKNTIRKCYIILGELTTRFVGLEVTKVTRITAVQDVYNFCTTV